MTSPLRFRSLDPEKEPTQEDQESPSFSFRSLEKPSSSYFKSRSDERYYPAGVSFLKGLAKGLPSFASMAAEGSPIPGLGALTKHLLPDQEKTEKELEEKYPTRPAFVEKTLERFGEMPYPPARGLASAVVGQTAEEAGLPKWGQKSLEMATFAFPGFKGKMLPGSAKESAALDLGRESGLSEAQIAPLIPGRGKKLFFQSLASKGEATQNALKATYEGLQNVFENLRNRPEAKRVAFGKSSPEESKMMKDFFEIIDNKIPIQDFQKFQPEFERFLGKIERGTTAESLIDLHRRINSYHSEAPKLQLLKGPIAEAMEHIDPKLSKDFKTGNEMFQNFLDINKRLVKHQGEKTIDAAKSVAIAAALAKFNFGFLAALLPYSAVRKGAAQMLLSPRMQNLHKQAAEALRQNKRPILLKTGQEIEKEMRKFGSREKEED